MCTVRSAPEVVKSRTCAIAAGAPVAAPVVGNGPPQPNTITIAPSPVRRVMRMQIINCGCGRRRTAGPVNPGLARFRTIP